MPITEILIYGFLLIWGVVVVTHALTRANCAPITQVIEVRTIDNTPNVITYNNAFVLDRRYIDVVTPEMLEYEITKCKEELFFSLPANCFEIRVFSDSYQMKDTGVIKMKIIQNRDE